MLFYLSTKPRNLRLPQSISSPNNPRLKRIIALRKPRQAKAEQIVIAEGVREISRALLAGLTLQTLVFGRTFYDQIDVSITGSPAQDASDNRLNLPWIEQAHPRAELLLVPDELLAKVSYRDHPEGCVAVFGRPIWMAADLHPPADALMLVADRIEKPGNLGAMLRTAVAAGVHAVLVSEPVCDLWNPNIIRSSTGACFSLPIIETDQPGARNWLLKNDFDIVVADPAAKQTLGDIVSSTPSARSRTALVIGSEDQGLDPRWLEPHTRLHPVRIPMAPGPVDSLNASVAAGVLLFQLARHRPGKPASDQTPPASPNAR